MNVALASVRATCGSMGLSRSSTWWLWLPKSRSRRIASWRPALEDARVRLKRHWLEIPRALSTVFREMVGLVSEGDSDVTIYEQSWSGSLAVVPVMQSADLRDRHDAATARGHRARNRGVLV
jgi:hypothetical protein